ncbi:MAG TPA: ATP-binding cassette domain-containing protein, partial [Anaerolineales bacterium]|nr:ATP-binding cassette domain-containing protein [Anaerolineales bacterium]
MNNSNGHVIDTRELTKTYKGVNALQGLSLKVPRNSIYGFLGPNGAGKSTAIKLLLGLTHPTAGKALIFGKNITQESLAVRRKVGYLAQDPRYYEHMT